MRMRIINCLWQANSIPAMSGLLFAFTLLIVPMKSVAQQEYEVLRPWLFLRGDDNALYRHFYAEAAEQLASRSQAVAHVASLDDWQQRQRWIKETLLDVIGPFPDKTPLNARTMRTVQKQGFRVEHIIFESQPGFYVTSSLYIPEGLTAKAPVIVYCSGHSPNGYRAESYQRIILNLVKKGFIVFAFDPVGQGERLEYLHAESGKSRVGLPTREHDMPGVQAFIAGSSQGRYMMWDGIRAIDYLIGRPEVDPNRIGMAGRSGGGTQTAMIGALDDRVLAAAPEGYITDFTRLLQTLGPADAEQTLFNGIARGLDEPDFLAVRAPKPTLVIATVNDYFNIQGTRDTYREVSRIYDAYGAADQFRMVEDVANHASTKRNREAMYAFFQEVLDNPGDPTEAEIPLLTSAEMQVTETGQVSTSLDCASVFSLNAKFADALVAKLNESRQHLDTHLWRVRDHAEQLSGFRAPNLDDRPVFSGLIQRDGFVIEKYYIKGEGDYVIPYLLYRPAKPTGKAVLYLPSQGKAAVTDAPEIVTLVMAGCLVLIPDIIGTGETGPGQWREGDFFAHSRMDKLSHRVWYGALLVGRSIVGVRAADVVKLAGVLTRDGTQHLAAVAERELAPVLLHAAVFDTTITRVVLKEPFVSYHSLVSSRYYRLDYIESAVPGVLSAYDLPDLAACVAPRKLWLAGVKDGTGAVCPPETIAVEMHVAKTAYEAAPGQLEIRAKAADHELMVEFFADWML